MKTDVKELLTSEYHDTDVFFRIGQNYPEADMMDYTCRIDGADLETYSFVYHGDCPSELFMHLYIKGAADDIGGAFAETLEKLGLTEEK